MIALYTVRVPLLVSKEQHKRLKEMANAAKRSPSLLCYPSLGRVEYW